MGKRDNEKAEEILGNCTALMLLFSVVLMAVIFIWCRPLLLMFGASENTIQYAEPYMRIYTWGTPFVQLALGLNAFISAQGFTRASMNSVIIGAVANIILDPIFIFLLEMGPQGARPGHGDLPGHLRPLDGAVPYQRAYGAPHPPEIPADRLVHHCPLPSPGPFSLYYAGDGKRYFCVF